MRDINIAHHPPLIEKHVEAKHCNYLEIAPAIACESVEHLEKFFQDIVDKGGEGIILRNPVALLQPGRNPGYLKHKVLHHPSPDIPPSFDNNTNPPLPRNSGMRRLK